jgi:uncharacterized membrane protein YedE/YeeE
MALFISLLAGLIFGLGLILSGMVNPERILGFLDLTGRWDPTLIFVMAGALLIGFLAFFIAKRRTSTFLGLDIKLPAANQIDWRLIFGSTLFGIGWGIAGFCPGPAIVSLGIGGSKVVVFVVSMLLGMVVFELLELRTRTNPSAVEAK